MLALRRAWGRLSAVGRVVVAACLFAVATSSAVAVLDPAATSDELVATTVAFVVVWAVLLALAREQLAVNRLADADYFYDDRR